MYVSISFLLFLISCLLNFKVIERLPTKHQYYRLTLLLLIPVFVVASPIALLTFVIFKLYQSLLKLILKLKLGSKFLGFFQNQDGLHVNSSVGACTIHVLLIIEPLKDNHSENNIFSIVYNLIDNVIIKNGHKLPKFNSTYQEYMGYCYMQAKEDINLLKCVKKMKIIDTSSEITKLELMQLLSDYYTEPLPYNNTLMWDVHVGMQPLKWKTNRSNHCYPILFRFHHSLADAINIFEFISGVFGYNSESSNFKLHEKEPITVLHSETRIESIINWLNVFLFMPAVMYSALMIRNMFSFNSKSKSKHKKRIVAFHIEESQKYLQKIKNLRKKYSSTFTSILLTAFSTSLKEYYIKHEKLVPEYETFVVPFHPRAQFMQTLLPGSKCIDEIDLHNRYNINYLTLPADLQSNGNSIQRLNLITKLIKIDSNSMLQRVFQSYMNLYNTLAPLPMTRLFATFVNFGPSISSMPASSKIKFVNEYLSVCDYMFFVPDTALFSFSIYMTSYDKRLQIALIVPGRKYTIDDAEWILNKFVENIDKLEKESNLFQNV